MNKFEIGEKLKLIRISQGISQDEVAKYLSSTPQKVSSFETGRTRIALDVFVQLCDYYGITPNQFFDYPIERFSREETVLLSLFRELNEEGREKMIDNGRDLVASGRYIKNDKHTVLEKEA